MNKLLVLDVETAGGFGNPLVYDFGYKVVDRKGNEYDSGSYIINDIFRNDRYMRTAYYKAKVPQYWEDINAGNRSVISIEMLGALIEDILDNFNIEAVCAYNAKFDMNALINTFCHFGFDYNPFGSVPVYDIWGMACETIGQQKHFFSDVDEYDWKSECGNPRTSAEIMWRYISQILDFDECHTGREDVEIECEIMRKCFATHKKMTKYIIANPWRLVANAYNDYNL